MVDPLSITSGCAGLLSSIASLTLTITKFVSSVRDARKDMDGVRRELSSLQLCVENLQDDAQNPKLQYPPSLLRSLVDVLQNCDLVTKDMETLLEKSTSKSLGKRIQWVATQQDEMNKLRQRLEAHKATIDIALDMVTIFIVTAVKEDTMTIKEQTAVIVQNTAEVPGIKADTSQLLAEISNLRLQLAQTQPVSQDRTYVLQRFLDESTSYAETVMGNDSLDKDVSAPSSSRQSFEHDKELIDDKESSQYTSVPPDPLQVSSDLTYRIRTTVSTRQNSGTAITSPTISTPQQTEPARLNQSPSNPPSNMDKFAKRKQTRMSLPDDHARAMLDEKLRLYVVSNERNVNADELRAYLDRGADINSLWLGGVFNLGFFGNMRERKAKITLLYYAVFLKLAGLIRSLITEGADVNTQGGHYGNVLQAASARGETDIVRLLLDKGADVNAPGGHYGNALQAASIEREIDIVRLLLDKGADVNAQGGHYGNALQAASARGEIDIVRLLLDNGADVNAQGGLYGNALQAASYQGRIGIVRFPRDKGSDIQAQGEHYGNTRRAASTGGKIDIVRLLLDKGADINAQGGHYGNALQAASFGLNIDTVRLLLDNGADVNAQGGHYGNALQAVSYGGNIDTVRLFLDKGADVNTQGGHYGNALQAASYRGNIDTVRLLLDKGADVNAQGGNCGNALQAASYMGKIDTVRLLLDNGADVNAQGGLYGNALQAASEGKETNIVRLLLDRGADINTRCDEIPGTALHAAIAKRDVATMKLLLDRGANINILGGAFIPFEKTALEWAETSSETASTEAAKEILAILKERTRGPRPSKKSRAIKEEPSNRRIAEQSKKNSSGKSVLKAFFRSK